MTFKKENIKTMILSMTSFITTFAMFSKLKYDYSMLEFLNNNQNNYIVNLSYNDNIPLKIVDTFEIFKNEYIIGMVVLLFCTIASLKMTYDIYNKIIKGDKIGN